MRGGVDEDVPEDGGGEMMAKFSFDFDVDDVMKSIEDELSEIIQSEIESEEGYMFQKLPCNSQKLLEDILESDDPAQMLRNRFENCSRREDDELRGIMRELSEKGYIKTVWGSNVPSRVFINNSALTYHEQLAEYERMLQAQIGTTNNYIFNNTNGIMVLGDISDSTILFDALREKAEHLENEEEIKERISNMEKCVGKKSFVEKYNAFIQSVANHMTIFAPFIPMLTKLLPMG